MREVGVARCTFPDGEVLDRVGLDVVPASAPCWFPGPAPTILYGGTDGQLYQLAFDDRGPEGSDEPERQMHPEPISWDCEKPGDGEVRIADPTWPADPRLGGRIVVSLTYLERVGEKATFVPAQIWWLKLRDDGRAIEAAGRLTVHRGRPAVAVQERFPSVAATPDRGLALAYLSRPVGQAGWDLKLAPVVLDGGDGHPRARSRASVCLARDAAVSPPVFSPDGSCVLALRSPAKACTQAERFPVADALPARDVRQLASRPDPSRGLARRLHAPELLRSLRSDRFHGKS
jgi:hypothetical protein